MWLLLTTVTFNGPKNKQTSLVRKFRVNMDKFEMYVEAPEDMQNHKSENAKVNTLLFADSDKVVHVKETVKEIDEMMGIDRLFDDKDDDDVKNEPIELPKNDWGSFKS